MPVPSFLGPCISHGVRSITPMRLTVLKSKLHLATVTRSDLNYHGSLTIDPDLMDAVGLYPYEAILVSNVATGLRAQTYVLPGERGKGRSSSTAPWPGWARWETGSS